jgi:threonine-phosphate decarboxylase
MVKSTHGGNIYEASLNYGIKEADILDFSSNINPLGLSKKIREVLISNIDRLIEYPDPECNTLREELSKYLNIPKDVIAVGNGASEMIYSLFDVLKPTRVLMPAPCFTEYERVARIHGSKICYYELKEEDEFRLCMKDFILQIKDNIDTVLLCNPNNPTSTLIDNRDILSLIEYAKERDVNVIIDEAFIELTIGGNNNSIVEYLQKYNNIFIIRALTKILAIPGLRIGYALGNLKIINEIWERKTPWSVNTFACNIGKVMTGDTEYFEYTSSWLRSEKEWLYNELCKNKYLKVFKPDTNFILLKLCDCGITSSKLKEMLILKGILIRDASNFQFLDNRFFRIAIKDRKSNAKIIEVLKDILYTK